MWVRRASGDQPLFSDVPLGMGASVWRKAALTAASKVFPLTLSEQGVDLRSSRRSATADDWAHLEPVDPTMASVSRAGSAAPRCTIRTDPVVSPAFRAT